MFQIATAVVAHSKPINWDMYGVIATVVIFVLGIIATGIGAYHRLGAVEKSIDKDIKPDIKSLRTKIDKANSDLGGRIDKVHGILLSLKLDQSGAVEGNSPRILTPKGERILEESGIKEIVENRLGDIISDVKAKNPENEYRIEQCVIEYVRELGQDASLRKQIEQGAFNSGTTVDVVLFVGAIYIRDQVIAAIAQKPEAK
jgi:hypothetical protein